MAIAEAAARGEPDPAPLLIEHETLVPPTPPPAPAVSRLTRKLALLTTHIRVVSNAVLDEARTRGFTDGHLLNIFVIGAYRHSRGTVAKPGAWIVAILREDVPESWDHTGAEKQEDIDAAKAWAYSDAGPLHAGSGQVEATAAETRRSGALQGEAKTVPVSPV